MLSYWQAKGQPIHVTLKSLHDKYELKWLRISMSYHRFSNLREIVQGDLVSKLKKGVVSMDFVDRPCNCYKSTKDSNGMCVYGGKCRRSTVVYKATCKVCNMCYIGNTQQYIKNRMDQHFSDTARLVNCGEKSDSFADHFAKHFKDGKMKRKHGREMVEMEILWQGEIIGCMKSFKQLNFWLCMQERLEILKMAKKEPKKLINSRSEIYGGCQHNTKFHRYHMNGFGTDDGLSPEKGPQ